MYYKSTKSIILGLNNLFPTHTLLLLSSHVSTCASLLSVGAWVCVHATRSCLVRGCMHCCLVCMLAGMSSIESTTTCHMCGRIMLSSWHTLCQLCECNCKTRWWGCGWAHIHKLTEGLSHAIWTHNTWLEVVAVVRVATCCAICAGMNEKWGWEAGSGHRFVPVRVRVTSGCPVLQSKLVRCDCKACSSPVECHVCWAWVHRTCSANVDSMVLSD